MNPYAGRTPDADAPPRVAGTLAGLALSTGPVPVLIDPTPTGVMPVITPEQIITDQMRAQIIAMTAELRAMAERARVAMSTETPKLTEAFQAMAAAAARSALTLNVALHDLEAGA